MLRCLLFISQTYYLIPLRTSALMEMAGVSCLIGAVCLSLLKIMHNINICTGISCWNPSYYAFGSVAIIKNSVLDSPILIVFFSNAAGWLEGNNMYAFCRHFNLVWFFIYTWFKLVCAFHVYDFWISNAILHLTQLINRNSYILKQLT